MKRSFIVTIVCLIILISFITPIHSLPWPPEIDIYYIKFNYESGNSCDALKIKNISAPEWANGGSTNKEIAYIKNQSSRRIKAKFWIDRTSIDWICVYAEKISGTGIGDVQDSQIDFNGSQYSQEEQLTCGSVPGSVGKRNFTWRWYAFAIDDYELEEEIHIGDTGSHTYYTVLASPISPMSEPWKDVLDYACDWASGKSTSSSALEALTTELYTNSGLYYDGSQSHYELDRYPNPTKCTFNLTEFLNEWDKADCQDCGMFLSILSSSIGASLTLTRRIEGSFTTKKLCAIGWSSTRWEDRGWNFHHIGWLNNVYDPCIKIKQSSPYIPINKDINNPYKTDLYNSGTWSPKNPFRLGETDPYWNVPTYIN